MIFNLFKNKKKQEIVQSSPTNQKRSLKGGRWNRFTNWIYSSLTKVNSDIRQDLLTTITRCRELAKNDPIVRSYLSMCQKNIIGKSGITLQSQLKNADGTLNEALNDEIEWKWYEFGKTSNGYLTLDGSMGHNDFDALILRTLLIDGEVFIHVVKDKSNPFGISFEIIDSASIDYSKRREFSNTQNAIILGVEIDRHYKEVAYWMKPGNSTTYQVGQSVRIPASEMIHIFKHEFPQQSRGIPPFNAILDDLKQLDDYKIAELMGAKTAACLSIFYERNNMTNGGDFLEQSSDNEQGEFLQHLEPGIASVTPTGYNVKSVAPTHPNAGYAQFNKAILKQVAASLGVSYAKLCKDYEAVNYSSLREGTIDEGQYFEEQQQFLIECWKELEYKLFIQSLALKADSPILPSQVDNVLKNHVWISPKRAYFDPGKDILADERKLKLGLVSPIELLEADGKDPDEVYKSWALYNTMMEKYGLNFNVTGENNKADSNDSTETNSEETDNQDEMLDKARD